MHHMLSHPMSVYYRKVWSVDRMGVPLGTHKNISLNTTGRPVRPVSHPLTTVQSIQRRMLQMSLTIESHVMICHWAMFMSTNMQDCRRRRPSYLPMRRCHGGMLCIFAQVIGVSCPRVNLSYLWGGTSCAYRNPFWWRVGLPCPYTGSVRSMLYIVSVRYGEKLIIGSDKSFAVVYQQCIVYSHSTKILQEGTSHTHTSNYTPAQPICPALVSAPNINLISNNSLELPILLS